MPSSHLLTQLPELNRSGDVYVVRDGPSLYLIDKFTVVEPAPGKKKPSLKKVRYVVTALQSCTCKGYEHRRKCKHLQMAGNAWEGKGVSGGAAYEEAQRLSELIPNVVKIPESAVEGLPVTVTQLDLCVTASRPQKGVRSIVFERKIPAGGTLVVYLTFEPA